MGERIFLSNYFHLSTFGPDRDLVEHFSIGTFFVEMFANTLSILGLMKNGDAEKIPKEDQKFYEKKMANLSEFVRKSEMVNFDFEKKMMYISEKIEAFEEKFPFGQMPFDQIYDDHVYKMKFEGEEERSWFESKYEFVKFVFPTHRSHFKFSEPGVEA